MTQHSKRGSGRVVISMVREKIRNAAFAMLDARDVLIGRKGPMTPPRRLINVGSRSRFRSDFTAVGEMLLGYLIDVGGFKPEDRVLEVGCGVGRMPIAMMRHITTGSYDGFDIIKESIEHCQHAITPRNPNFRFKHVDIYNSTYNPRGTIRPADFRFPYPDSAFTFVFLTSVFTHMQRPELERYMGEICRVLLPGGRAFASYFLLNSASLAAMDAGASDIVFAHASDKGRVQNRDDPDQASAFDEAYITDLYPAAGMRIMQVKHGSWTGLKTDVLGYQDIISAVKM